MILWNLLKVIFQSVSSISVFITGFVVEHIQNDNIFKGIKTITTEFTGGGNTGKKFYIKCRYLRSDERIDKKVSKTRKNLSIFITGELNLNPKLTFKI